MQPEIEVLTRRAAPKKKWRKAHVGGGAWLILIVMAALLIFAVWAQLSQVDELVRARGQVIAAARTQVVEASDNGIIEQILVREGQPVRKGQILVKLDQSRVRAAYDDSQNKVAALNAQLSRLRAEVYGTSLTFSPDLAAWPAFRENQSLLYERRRRALLEGVAALQSSRQAVIDELSVTEPLLRTGDVGRVEVIRLRRAKSELDGQIVNLRNKFFQDAQAEMTKAEEDLATQEELLRERSAVLGYTELRAPVDGQIRKISVTTVGAAVKAGDPIVEMLPTSSNLIVEAKYQPSDVASLHVGLPANVKLDAYDPSIFGSLEGRVVYISPDALSEMVPQQGEHFYYRVQIALDPQRPRPGHKPIPINAGMTVTVEVRSKKRTIVSFLTKPITKTLHESMGEH